MTEGYFLITAFVIIAMILILADLWPNLKKWWYKK